MCIGRQQVSCAEIVIHAHETVISTSGTSSRWPIIPWCSIGWGRSWWGRSWWGSGSGGTGWGCPCMGPATKVSAAVSPSCTAWATEGNFKQDPCYPLSHHHHYFISVLLGLTSAGAEVVATAGRPTKLMVLPSDLNSRSCQVCWKEKSNPAALRLSGPT